MGQCQFYKSCHNDNNSLKALVIITSHKQQDPSPSLINYLEVKIGLSEKALKLGLKQSNSEQAPLPVVLWSLGLLTLDQLQQVLDWETGN